MRKSTHTFEYTVLRERLQEIRKRAGFSQRQLATALRVPHTWVAKVESGERRIDLVEFGWFCRGCGGGAGGGARGGLGEGNTGGGGARGRGGGGGGGEGGGGRRGGGSSAAQRAAA